MLLMRPQNVLLMRHLSLSLKNHLGNASGSALPNHLLQQGLGHGAHRHEDSSGCCDVSPRSPNQPTTSTPYRFSM
jgi:hypothetical protein